MQVVELLEAFTGWDTNNKYAIKNSMGQQIFYAFEKSDCCSVLLRRKEGFPAAHCRQFQ